ncbi:hypothetical protein H4582DRAFT_2110859 [Lactarius indigo]|nr:hypothetical protein H4582DRAFT_2110859 [Lactarius indigo]
MHVVHIGSHAVGLKPVFHPFCESLLLVNIFVSITLDILHQMLQGVMKKHLVVWLTHSGVFGTGLINTFSNGISMLSCISGQEHKNIYLLLPVTSCIIRSVHALLNFLYFTQLPSQTTNTVVQLNKALAWIHSNKAIFVDLGVHKCFNIPKSISLFGTTDYYNTEQTERLHIDFTKDASHVTNHKDEYPQMTTWLEHHEKVLQHTAFIKWQQQPEAEPWTSQPLAGPPGPAPCSVKMT